MQRLAVGRTVDGQAPNLLGLVGKAGEAAPGAHTRSRRRRARRALDDVFQSRDHHSGAPPRACPRSRLCRLRVRSGRLDEHERGGIASSRRRSGFPTGQRRVRGGPFRRSPRNATHLHPACERLQASERSPRSDVHPVRRNGDRRGDEGDQPKASDGDREQRPRRTDRGSVVAVFPDGANRTGALRRERPANRARPQRRSRGHRPRMATERSSLVEILERGREREGGALGSLLLLERRTPHGPRRSAVARDGRDSAGVRRPSIRVLDDAVGHAAGSERSNLGRLLADGSGGLEHPGRVRRSATRGIDHRSS